MKKGQETRIKRSFKRLWDGKEGIEDGERKAGERERDGIEEIDIIEGIEKIENIEKRER